jgi:two-component system sensor histidine kinase KdpD
LIALRELALRFLADETEEELLAHLGRKEPRAVWETAECIMAAVTASADNAVLVRRAARIASRVKADLVVLHVTAGDGRSNRDQAALHQLRELTADVGARWLELQDDDPARAIAEFARQHHITQIVIGSSQRGRLRQLASGGSNVARVIREAGTFGIDVHVIAKREDGLALRRPRLLPPTPATDPGPDDGG